MDQCVSCKGALKPGPVEQVIEVDGFEFTGSFDGAVCVACGESFIGGAEVENFELDVASYLVNNGDKTGAAFRFVRKTLGFRAADLASLIGVAAETVSRWETGEREVPADSWITLAGLVDDALENSTRTADRLAALKTKPVPKRVQIPSRQGHARRARSSVAPG